MFHDLIDVYEAMIDWPKRLAHEGPFYRRLFDRHGVRRVVDVACGVGQHAAMFHAWGLDVEGADLSNAMIERAWANFGEETRLHWTVRGFDQPIPSQKPFDAAVCIGNSLPLASDMKSVEQAIRQMFAAVRGGGLVVVHVLNLWRLTDGPCVWQKCRRVALPQGESLIIKGVHRCGIRGYVELLVADPAEGRLLQTESVPLLGLEATELEAIAKAAGAADVQFFGGYQDEPYDRETSVDLVMVGVKQG